MSKYLDISIFQYLDIPIFTKNLQGAWEPVNVDAAARTSAQEIEVENCADDDSEDDDDVITMIVKMMMMMVMMTMAMVKK